MLRGRAWNRRLARSGPLRRSHHRQRAARSRVARMGYGHRRESVIPAPPPIRGGRRAAGGYPCSIPGRAVLIREAGGCVTRSEEHTSALQSLMRISYAVLCLKKKKEQINDTYRQH